MGNTNCWTLAAAGGLACLVACAKGPLPAGNTATEITTSPEEAERIAQEAYVYAYPMLENYRTLYVQAVDRTGPGYMGPFNQLQHGTELLGPDFTDVVRPNNDTLYSFAWLDLRAQPVVISVPRIDDRYYSVQLVDMFTNNIGYIGPRTTGTDAGSYLVTGPRWSGAKPGDVAGEIKSDSEFVYCIIRTEVRTPSDVAAVVALQKEYHLTPLNVFLGRSRVPVAAGITFPRYETKKATSVGFIDYLNLFLTQVQIPESDVATVERFARIGVEPGMLSASTRLPEPIRAAVDAGVGKALVEISKAALDPSKLPGITSRKSASWAGMVGIFGSPEEMKGRYLARAAAAMFGLYGNDAEEAYYPVGNDDAAGDALDGSTGRYTMHFEKEQLPKVEAFWSMTMYGLPKQLMVANPINRYSIGDRSKLAVGKDGSVTIYIQHDAPEPDKRSNWLPAPDGPFSVQFRMYLPAQSVIESPLYLPPDIVKVR
ncbi:MAG: DUF1254 domain-containing protein [Myxococcota bacterium]